MTRKIFKILITVLSLSFLMITVNACSFAEAKEGVQTPVSKSEVEEIKIETSTQFEPVETREKEKVKTLKIYPDINLSGFMAEGEKPCNTEILWIGDDVDNKTYKGFMSFDLKELCDLHNLEIISVDLFASMYSMGKCGDTLEPWTQLIIKQVDYGNSLEKESFELKSINTLAKLRPRQYDEEVIIYNLNKNLKSSLDKKENQIQFSFELDRSLINDNADGFVIWAQYFYLDIKYKSENSYNSDLSNREFLNNLPSEIIKSPDTKINKYKAVGGNLREIIEILKDVDNYKKDGINTVVLITNCELIYDKEYFEVAGSDNIKDIKKVLSALHKNGFKIILFLGASADYCWFIDEILYEGGPNSAETYTEALYEKTKPIILKWAEIAEEYEIEMFGPWYEAQLIGGVTWEYPTKKRAEIMSNWAQDILPKIKDIYSGKLVFHDQGYLEKLKYKIEGYEYLFYEGLPWFAVLKNDPYTNNPPFYDLLLKQMKLYPNMKILIATEAFTGPGAYEFEPMAPAHMIAHNQKEPNQYVMSTSQQAEFFNTIFTNTWDIVSGYDLEIWPGDEYRNKPAEEIIREWFNKP